MCTSISWTSSFCSAADFTSFGVDSDSLTVLGVQKQIRGSGAGFLQPLFREHHDCEQCFGASVLVDRGVQGRHTSRSNCVHASGLDYAMPLMIMKVEMSFEPPLEHSDATLYIYGSGICNPIICKSPSDGSLQVPTTPKWCHGFMPSSLVSSTAGHLCCSRMVVHLSISTSH